MDNQTKIQYFQKSLRLFIIGQALIILGTLQLGAQIKALPEWLALFFFFDLVGSIMMIVSALRMYSYNKNFFYCFLTAFVYLFIVIIVVIGNESTSDFTVAWVRGLSISSDILLCVIYVYFFLGTGDYCLELGVVDKPKKSKAGYIFVISATIIRNILDYLRTFSAIRTNYILVTVFKYSGMLIVLVAYIFVLVVLILIYVHVRKKLKEVNLNEKAE